MWKRELKGMGETRACGERVCNYWEQLVLEEMGNEC